VLERDQLLHDAYPATYHLGPDAPVVKRKSAAR
jgi:hypothetical protein